MFDMIYAHNFAKAAKAKCHLRYQMYMYSYNYNVSVTTYPGLLEVEERVGCYLATVPKIPAGFPDRV